MRIAHKFKYIIFGVIALEFILLILGIYDFSSEEIEPVVIELFLKYALMPSLLLGLLTTSFFHYLSPNYKDIFNGIDKSLKNKLKLAFRLLITTPGLTLVLFIAFQGTVGFINRTFGSQQSLKLKGVIQDKYTYTSKGNTRYYFKFYSNEINKSMSISTDEYYYNLNNIGDSLQEEIIVGSLGYWYKLK